MQITSNNYNKQSFGMNLGLGEKLSNKVLTTKTNIYIECLKNLLNDIGPHDKYVKIDLTEKGSLRFISEVKGDLLIKEIDKKLFKVKELKNSLKINFNPLKLIKMANELGERITDRINGIIKY